MQNDDRPSSSPPEVQVATVETDTPDYVAVPAIPQPKSLIEVFRLLQQRIPGFTHLSLAERRSMARAGNLDPEFLEEGITTACAAGDDATHLTSGMTGEECRSLSDEIRIGDEVYREAMVMIKGLASTNLERKYRLGQAILNLYAHLGHWMDDSRGRYRHLQPYFERMQRAYPKNRKTRRQAGTDDGKETPETPETPTE